MNKLNTSALVPKLRFPEFLGDGGWKEKKIKDICIQKNSHISLNQLEGNSGIYKLYGASGYLKSIDFYTEKYNYIAIVKDGSGVGKIMLLEPETSVLGTLSIIKARQDSNVSFLHYLLQRINFNKYITGSTIPHIYYRDYKTEEIVVPKILEQQKIAICLLSLDDLITVQSQKLATLKTHKKGLMQQLFPNQNQTTPTLRFPEFLKYKTWKVIKLGDVGKISMCKRILKQETTLYGDVPFYKIGTFGKKADAFISKSLYKKYLKYSFPKNGDILISASGTIGRVVIYDGKPAYFQDSNIVWVDNDESVLQNNYLFYCYKKVKWNAENSTISRLYNDNLKKVQVSLPSKKEQQKIADCLSSIDDLIATQNQKLAVLKTHKKGLMQQLFPINERAV